MKTATAAFDGTGVLTTNAGGELVLRRVKVRVVSGPSAGAEALLAQGTLVIGSHRDADLVVQEPTVSRYHAELGLLADGVRVRDLGSTNGTYVGQARVESIVVTPGTEIRVGKARVELLPDDVPAPEPPSDRTSFGVLSGASPAMRKVFGVLERAAGAPVPILVEGEPGTGKSEAARAVHEASSRSGGPFVVVDAASPHAAVEVGVAFERAAGGTVVIDRIDEAGAPALEALVTALGRRERGELDVRPIAMSRSDLRARVSAGACPRELYFHVASVRVVLPPLRERREDLPRLVRELCASLGFGQVQLTPQELGPLASQPFEGNVRQLARMIEQTLVRSGRASAPPPPPGSSPELLGPGIADAPFKEAKERLVDAFGRQYVAELLERHQGNVSRAAAEAGIDRNHLARLAKKHDLR